MYRDPSRSKDALQDDSKNRRRQALGLSWTKGHWHVTLAVGQIMGTQRAHVVLPTELIAEIDSAVGPRGRSAFLAETARAELNKRKLLAFLRNDEPAWKDEDHPELKDGTAAWVRSLRQESDRGLQAKLDRDRD
jgi:hypothetical protein